MSLADLRNTSPDSIESWARAISDVLGKTILFNTHPDGAGSAATGPLIRVNPTQVVAYELFSTTRHVDSDANEGDAASVTLFRAISVDPSSEPELFTTILGANTTAQLDTNMRYLIDSVTAEQAGLNITYHTSGGTNTGNTIPGILSVPLSLDSFGDVAPTIIEAHTHVDNSQGGTLGNGSLSTGVTSLAGSLSTGVRVNLTLQPRSFFPHIHVTQTATTSNSFMTPHNTDVSDADQPRMGLLGPSTETYDVDQRYIIGA